jgi:hypothetical protein
MPRRRQGRLYFPGKAERLEEVRMPINRINWLAVVAGGIIYFVWGWLWYGVLFQKQWSALHPGLPTTSSATPFIVSIVMAFVLSFGVAVALSHDDNRTVRHGIEFGVFFGLLFLASTMLTGYMFANLPLALWAIDAGYVVLGLMILGALHGGWKRAPAGQLAKASGGA